MNDDKTEIIGFTNDDDLEWLYIPNGVVSINNDFNIPKIKEIENIIFSSVEVLKAHSFFIKWMLKLFMHQNLKK
ncbi:hypothetical protein H9M94_00980 [Mycoplasma sp. Pen4]|uniref:hypothetical protein n=1 Tax=Mycoplasma sp. Pen4 TaxID=640330 RepID=UPI001654BB36|nr:hypothetical protein [Mycoplasma sp. Pen4]QNM93832.1 hypothetical protein H9M94_00980 [Mycoplasma sp. Pen4]